MRDYELTVLLSARLSDKELDKETKGISDSVTKVGGKIKKAVDPTRKNLSYRILGQAEAFCQYLELSLEPAKTKSLEQLFAGNEQIIRYLLIKKE